MELKKGYKNTEVGVIPEEWEVVKVTDILDLLTDYDANGSFSSIAENVRAYDSLNYAWYVRSTDLENNTDISKVRYIDKESYRFLKKTKLFGGELLFLKRGDIGNVYLFKMKTKYASLAPNLYLLKLNKRTISTYQYYFFTSKYGQSQLKSKNASSTLGAIYKDDVKSIKIPLPPLPEQTAIATVLSETDSLIQALEKKIAKKQLIKKGAMQELLKPKEGWERVKLDKVIEVNRGGSPRPIQDYITSSPFGINWIKIGDTSRDGKYITETKEKIIPEGAMNSREVKVGDFLLSNSMSFGRPYILKIDGCIHDGWLVLQNYQDSFDREFLYYTLMSKDVFNQYMTKAAGSGVLNLNKELVKTVELNRPKDIKEQTRIAQILTDIDNEIETLENKLSKYKQLKQGLMQELLTGRIRLSEL